MTTFDQEIMARTAIGEARGEGQEGMIAVMWTGMNRHTAKRWYSALTLAGVFLKREQYSCWNSEDVNYGLICNIPPGNGLMISALQMADMVIRGITPDPTLGATHYVDLAVAQPDWVNEATHTVKLGKHDFYKSVA